MPIGVVSSIAAALVLGLGTWIELRYRRRTAVSTEDDELDKPHQPSEETAQTDDDSVADIIRRARPALERAADSNKSDQRPKAR